MTVSLPRSWIPAERRIDHPERRRLRMSPARVKIVAGARRSGKSTDGREFLIVGHGPEMPNGEPMFSGALCPPIGVNDPTYVAAAPTREMVKRLWWGQLKAMLPNELLDHAPNETELTMRLVTGARIMCLGMDRPTRGEGFAIDGLTADEFAYWKPLAYQQSLRPALSTRGRPPGWAVLMGKPSGRNHFWEMWEAAKSGKKKGQDAFHWPSSVIIDPAELDAAKDELDLRSYQQEYEASFLTQTGLVFYVWDPAVHIRPLQYNPALPLVLCFDFNVSPGAAVIVQEQTLAPIAKPDCEEKEKVVTTCVIDEVYRADDSNTPWVCAQIAARYSEHKGPVLVYGDAAGNQRRTSASATDWEIVKTELRKAFSDVRMRVPSKAPPVIDSVHTVNARLRSTTGVVRLAVDARKAEQTVRDFEGLVWDKDKDHREIDKGDGKRSHWAEGLRNYIHEAHPMRSKSIVSY